MHQVNIHEAKTHLSRLIQKALEGEEVIISKDNKPLIRLEVLPEAQPKRRVGGAKNIIKSISADFDNPLDEFANYME